MVGKLGGNDIAPRTSWAWTDRTLLLHRIDRPTSQRRGLPRVSSSVLSATQIDHCRKSRDEGDRATWRGRKLLLSGSRIKTLSLFAPITTTPRNGFDSIRNSSCRCEQLQWIPNAHQQHPSYKTKNNGAPVWRRWQRRAYFK